ncbi:DUF4982 domain-containing protein [bacterium]|nr:DUF4982 domain-containing protein [bacterium]
MKIYLQTLVIVFAGLTWSLLSTANVAAEESVDLNRGWKFQLGDPSAAANTDFDDEAWRTLDVPHDWAFESPYARDAAQKDKGGYKPGGIGWYRKSFELPKTFQGKRISIRFDGVYMNSQVWLNGKLLGKRPYGYIPFEYDLNEALKPGINTIAVRVDNSKEPSARWYHGCGIYANVRLLATEAVSIESNGVWVRTAKVNDRIAEMQISAQVTNHTDKTVRATLTHRLVGPDGSQLNDQAQSKITLQPGQQQVIESQLRVKSPALWDIQSPNLYQLRSEVVHGSATDTRLTKFGIRTIAWKPETGFWLNGKVTKLLGVADHLEAGPVGMAYPEELLRWKLQLLKNMGCNAIRTAHNPQVPTFYDLCDELGILVMDEIFDGWKKKAPVDYGQQAFAKWWKKDLEDWVVANRNHPCIVIWSMGNETHGEIGKQLVQRCHQLDPTRPVTSGSSDTKYMDVEGVNGAAERPSFIKGRLSGKRSKPFVATEAPHTWQVRGYYRSQTWFRDGPPKSGEGKIFPLPNLTDREIFEYSGLNPSKQSNRKQIFNSSYDNATVRISARQNWELMRDLPWYSGHFRWTGMDYIGEAGYVHGGWPFRAFMGGAIDLAGFPKDLFYFYQSQWTEKPMVHLLPHWTHPRMKPGTEIPVWAYSNADRVDLFLNDKKIGSDQPGKRWDEMQCEWKVPWQPGELRAVAYRDGKEVAETVQQTAGAPAALKLSVEGSDFPIVTVAEVDSAGVMNPYAENRVHYHIDGPAEIVSLESGNPVNTEPNFGASSRATFFGLGRCFLKRLQSTGEVSLIAGAILGDKQLHVSDKISIDVQQIDLRCKNSNPDLTIRYSLNSSAADLTYAGPFALKPGTTVTAKVMRGSEVIFEMSEKFGPDEGLYWGTEATPVIIAGNGGDQAEDATLYKAKVRTKGKGFLGRGFVDFGNAKGAYIEWYRENDGDAESSTATFRYSGKRGGGKKGSKMKLTINGQIQVVLFPNTQGWGSDWKTLEIPIKLKSGANSIRLTTEESGGMYFDEMKIE